MNRQLKFRAWRENKMHFNITKAHYEHNAMSGSGGDLWDFAEWLKWSKVMQYTGLTDKNGVDIYEGDFVEIIYGENLVGEVYFQSTMGTFRVKCNDENSYPLVTYNIEANKLINVVEKVIGNIYEPPELVEQTV